MFDLLRRKWLPPSPRTTELTRVVEGWLWHFAADAPAEFRDSALSLAPLLANPDTLLVKQNLQRSVYRISLPGGAGYYLKLCRVNTPRTWAREVLRPPKAQLEFEHGQRVLELGFCGTVPVAWAQRTGRGPQESLLVTRASMAVPFESVLQALASPAQQRLRATELGHWMAKLHEAGLSHPDPHPGNILFDAQHDAAPQFVLHDVHALQFGPVLTWHASLQNLVLLNRWFQLRVSRSTRSRFWRAYFSSRPSLQHCRSERLAREVETGTLQSNLQFWAARQARSLGNNRQYRKVSSGAWRGHAVCDLDANLLSEWLANPLAPFKDATAVWLKDSPSSSVVALPNGVICKRFRSKKRGTALKNLLRRSAALRCWVLGHNLLDRGLATARPLFVAHRYRGLLPDEAVIAFETVPDAVELPESLRNVSDSEKQALLWQLAGFIRQMHERGVAHRDLKAANVLIRRANGQPVLIDLVGVTTARVIPRSLRIRDLVRLNVSFTSTAVPRTSRLKFLRWYLGRFSREDWRGWWKRIARGSGVKIRKNLQSGRPLAEVGTA